MIAGCTIEMVLHWLANCWSDQDDDHDQDQSDDHDQSDYLTAMGRYDRLNGLDQGHWIEIN